MTGFTPGPWGIERTPDMLWVGPLRHEGGKVADIVAPIEWGRDYRADFLAKQKANASLIAAAPELFVAAKKALVALNELSRSQPVLDAIYSLRAALAKAQVSE